MNYKGSKVWRVVCSTPSGDMYVFFFGADNSRIADKIGRKICAQLCFKFEQINYEGENK